MEDKKVLKFELSPKDVKIKKVLSKEFLELDIFALSDIYPNRNNCTFTLDGIENCKETCYNKPILGSFDSLFDDFREHNGTEKYDKEFEMAYWDCSNSKDERILGSIRESDKVSVVSDINNEGIHWLKISCALWTYYTYKQVKNLLKSATKKVSVEIEVLSSHFDDNKILVIDKFSLLGITILGDKIKEGVPGAHLDVSDIINDENYVKQMKCLSFAYNKKDKKNDIKQPDGSVLYKKNDNDMEGLMVTYEQKRKILEKALCEFYKTTEQQWDGYVCDFSDSYIVYRDWNNRKIYKVNYSLSGDDPVNITFDFDNKIEQVEAYVDKPAPETVTVNGVTLTLAELDQKYEESVAKTEEVEQKFSVLTKEYSDYKDEMSSKTFSILIEDTEYDINALNEKFSADIKAKDDEITALNEKFTAVTEELDAIKGEVKLAAEKQLCDNGVQLASEEEELDKDDKEAVIAKCNAHEYTSIEEVENDIAKFIYQKKKNKRQKNFFTNIPTPSVSKEKTLNPFDGLKNYTGNN